MYKRQEGILLLLVGASLATFANMLVALLQNVLNVQEYQENMAQITNGKSLFMLIFWMGVIAPLAEEIVFRWLIYLRLRDYTLSLIHILHPRIQEGCRACGNS